MEARIKVLVADDSLTIQKVFDLVFSDEPVDLTITGDGDSALQAALEIRPDVVLADIIMPGLNGYRLCKEIKTQLPGTPVVLLTGTFEPFDPNEAEEVGTDAILTKPFKSQAVVQLVQKLVAERMESVHPDAHKPNTAATEQPIPHSRDLKTQQTEPQPEAKQTDMGVPDDSSKLYPPTSSQRRLLVFLCHASNDKPTVRELYRRFVAEGFQPWFDEEDLLPGEDWRSVIRKQIRASDAVVVCLSPRSTTKAGYIQTEIAFALDVLAEQPEGSIFLIPLLLEHCEIPDRLAHLHVAHLPLDDGFARVCRSLHTLSIRKINLQV